MSSKYGIKPTKVLCLNCRIMTNAWRDEHGQMKSKCPQCGAITVSRVLSRRHMQYDVFAPNGEKLRNGQ